LYTCAGIWRWARFLVRKFCFAVDAFVLPPSGLFGTVLFKGVRNEALYVVVLGSSLA